MAVIIAVLLWYRNWAYDRLVAVVVIFLGVLQLINYGCHSSMARNTAGNLVVVTIWLLLLAYIFTIYVMTQTWLAGFLTLVALVLVIYVIYTLVSGSTSYYAYTRPGTSVPVWLSRDSQGQETGPLGALIWIFLAVIVLGWILLMQHYEWRNLGLYVLAALLILSALCVPVSYQSRSFGSYWSYLLVGLGLVCWLVGSLSPP